MQSITNEIGTRSKMTYNPMATFAKGCFLADTVITTPNGDAKIQDLEPGDQVLSFNEKTQKNEVSVINKIDILGAREFYTIYYTDGYGYGNEVKVTAEHPFYVFLGDMRDYNMYLKPVKELKKGDEILVNGRDDVGEITRIRKTKQDVVVYNLIDVTPNHNYYANDVLVHNKGGCFVDGTLISTPDGDVKIEDLEIGDKVWSLDTDTFESEKAVIGDIDSFRIKGYYMVTTESQTVRVTGEHPFYVLDDGQLIVKTVQDIYDRGTKDLSVYVENDTYESILSVQYFNEVVRVHNLINVSPNHNYFANKILVHNKGGGGCFTGGTRIMTPTGTKKIKNFRPGDTVVSYNEKTGNMEYAKVASIQLLEVNGYYVINDSIEATGTHPFYVDRGTKKYKVVPVSDLKIGDELVNDAGTTKIIKLQYVSKKTKVYNLINVVPNHNYYANNFLVHNKGGFSGGGGRSSSSAGKSSSSSSSSSSGVGKSTSSSTGSKGSSKSTNNAGSANKSNSRSTTSSETKPGSKITTSDGKQVQTSAKKPTNAKVNQQAGITGVDGYTPRFKNGYTPPAGSTVYYPQHSFVDYLPWIYLFSQDSPANDHATVVQPDGKEVTAPPVTEGADGLAIFNWVLLIAIIIGIIGGIVWGVNKLTKKDEPKRSSYGSWY